MNPRVGVIGLSLVVHFREVTIDEGTTTIADLDISTATSVAIYLKKPSGTVVPLAAVNDTTGTDGKAKYVTLAGTLDAPGVWKIWGIAVIGGNTFPTDESELLVKRAQDR